MERWAFLKVLVIASLYPIMNIDHTLIKNNKGNQMNQRRNYDLLLLLAGENEKIFPRSKKVIELYEKGTIGDILVSGSAGGFYKCGLSSMCPVCSATASSSRRSWRFCSPTWLSRLVAW